MWQAERERNGEDSQALFETIKADDGDIQSPWHARYLVVMPGNSSRLCREMKSRPPSTELLLVDQRASQHQF
jgi:hypothetical protein